MTKVSTLAAAAALLATAAGMAKPHDNNGQGDQKHGGGGQGPGGRPVIMPSAPTGGGGAFAPPGPAAFDKHSQRKEERREKGPAAIQAVPRGGNGQPTFSPGAGPGSFKQHGPPKGDFAPAGIPGGQPFPDKQQGKAEFRGRNSGGDFQQGQVRRKGDFQSFAPESPNPGTPFQPSQSAGPAIKPGRSFEPQKAQFKPGAAALSRSGGERGPKNMISPSDQGGFKGAGAGSQHGGKPTVFPGGQGGNSGFAGSPALSPGQAKQAYRAKGNQGGAGVVPGGQKLPPGLAGTATAPGLTKQGFAGRQSSPVGEGMVVPKGVARGITGNLPPGISKKLVPGAGMAAGISGKAVALPAEIQSSALHGFQNVKSRFGSSEPVYLPNLGAPEKAVVIGANLGIGGAVISGGYSKFLSKDDAVTFYGSLGNPVYQPVSLTKQDIVALRGGYLPDFVPPPAPGFGYVRPPVIPAAIYSTPGYLPPPIAAGVDFAPSFSWDYWDGRSYYDQSYASSLFVSLGHTRHDGFDGAIVGGHYYAFGYGWVDGCINYGQGRAWVPGFWAPQVVQECQPVPVWMPPVYEDVWTGCCWESVQVGGGFFAPAPAEECHSVTRYVWVPGHYEYYYV